MKAGILTKQMVDDFGREFIERGKLVEAGYAGYKIMFPALNIRSDEARRAFFAGAQHLFSSIMNFGLDEGTEPTESDLRRMDAIARELKAFEPVLEDAVRKMGN
jgi:hypothetical protein